MGPGKLSEQVFPDDHMETSEATVGGGLGISTAGGIIGGGGFQEYQDLHPQEA